MRALLYLKYRSLVNGLKQLKEKPGKLIGAIFYLGLLFVLFLPDDMAEAPNFSDLQTLGVDFASKRILSAGALIINTIIAVIALNSGTKTGVSIFSQADSHILFVSPMKPPTLLLFGMLGQLQASILSSVFLIYQIPNLKRLGLTGGDVTIFFIIWALTTFAIQIYSTFAYALSFQSIKRKNVVLSLAYGILLAIILTLTFFYLDSRDIMGALVSFLTTPGLYFIPIVGWSKALLDLLLLGPNIYTVIGSLLFFLMPAGLLVALYKINIDYYEDALTMTQQTATGQEEIERIAEENQKKALQKMKVRYPGIKKGFGESTIFFKEWREHRRKNPYLVSFLMLVILVLVGVIAFALKSSSDNPAIDPFILWAISGGIIYFSSFNSQIILNFSDPLFYLLPGNPLLKVFYASAFGIFIRMINVLPAYLFATIFLRMNPLFPLVGLVLLFSLLLIINGAQILALRIFGEIKSVISVMLLLLISFVSVIPTIILMVFASINLSNQNGIWSLVLVLITILINGGLGFLGLLIGKGLVKKGLAL